MKRFLLSLVLVFLTINTLFAQRDTEHWIAPYYTTAGSYTNTIYLSTDSTVPFDVKIYTNNNPTPLTTLTISKGDPKTYTVTATDIAGSATADAFQVIGKGLYLKADKPFYCSLRMANGSHGEIVTSKGKAGIGKTFHVAASPNSPGTGYNFTAGVLATEDNTTVTVSWATPGIVFVGGSPTGNTHTFVLNKGKSFLLTGSTTTGANSTGFIGAKIVSDKPISLTNGSVNGNFGAGGSSGSDAILDQAVPVDRLGNTFAIVKTKSTDPSENMEGGLVIATEDNTQIFVNGSTTPLATINAGQWYRINETNYVEQTAGSGHFNMFISTSKNVYLYQLVGVGTENNTGGFNYIPPLNCFLPRKIDEIGKINEMPGSTGAINLKLNIVTEAGATVLVNGIPPTAAQGPYPLTGNTLWQTYEIPIPAAPIANLTITSTKAVTAGINGGYSTAGYGGYFAGFSSIPVIAKKTGECVPGITLEVDDSYETYQWQLNGAAIPGATSSTYSPTQAGNYTVKVTMGSCQAAVTPIYKVYTCLKKTTTALNICATKVITPAFSSSTQTPVASTVTILTPPAHGTATLNPVTGAITYVPNTNYLGSDQIVYQFCGNAAEFIDCEQVTLNLTVVPFVVKDAVIKACQYDNDPAALFDLTTANIIDPVPGVTIIKKYYPSMIDLNAGSNQIMDPEHYASAGGFVYVKVMTNEGCSSIAKIELIALPIKKSPLLVDQYICIDDRTTLDAGPGYHSYEWNTGATTPSIQGVGVGEYWVILENNGCSIKQFVHVRKSQDPVITEIQITNNSATVIVNGGKAPYKYAVDGTTNWQDSNVFNNLSRGQHTFYVKDAYDCTPISVEITVPNLINAITPNGDNVNDYIDYSELSYKNDLSFMIYDRYGNKVFVGDRFNNYKWDGRHSNKKILTGTYWFHINWTEPNAEKTPIKYTGWILVKNRE